LMTKPGTGTAHERAGLLRRLTILCDPASLNNLETNSTLNSHKRVL
jgi:hypothetical protein